MSKGKGGLPSKTGGPSGTGRDNLPSSKGKGGSPNTTGKPAGGGSSKTSSK